MSQTEPEMIEETNVDRMMGSRRYTYGRGLKGHSETSSLSSQPSIDEVRHQMHLLLEEAFSLASGGQPTSGRHSHHHHPSPDKYNHVSPPLPYTEVVTSAPGTMSRRGGLQWVPSYGTDVYQCSLPRPVSGAGLLAVLWGANVTLMLPSLFLRPFTSRSFQRSPWVPLLLCHLAPVLLLGFL